MAFGYDPNVFNTLMVRLYGLFTHPPPPWPCPLSLPSPSLSSSQTFHVHKRINSKATSHSSLLSASFLNDDFGLESSQVG